MTLYPVSLPIDDVTLLISSFRGGSLLNNAPRISKSVWELAGYALLMTLGEPKAVVGGDETESVSPAIHLALQSAPVLTTEQVVEYLELLQNHTMQGVEGAVNVPWLAVLKWALTFLLGVL